jgi:hypothetical protein
MQDSEYESQNEIKFPLDITWSWKQYTLSFTNIVCSFFFAHICAWNFSKQIDFVEYVVWFVMLCFYFIWGEYNRILYLLQISIGYWQGYMPPLPMNEFHFISCWLWTYGFQISLVADELWYIDFAYLSRCHCRNSLYYVCLLCLLEFLELFLDKMIYHCLLFK